MEKENNYIVAIDMGTTKVAALVGLRRDDGKIEIVCASCREAKGIARGDIRNIDQIVRSVQEALQGVERESGIKICEAYVGLSGQHIRCKKHDGYVFIVNSEGEVREDDVYKLSDSMRNIEVPAGETIIHILPQCYILDGDPDINHPVGMIGKKLEGVFNIITGEKKSINLVDRCLGRAEVGIAEVILSSLASAEAVLVDDEKELGVAVIDIGGGTTDICIYYDNVIRYLGVIPIGGNIINRDIKSYGVLERHVEKLKVKFGSALSELVPDNQVITIPGVNNSPSREIPNKVLASIIEARMMDIIERVIEVLETTGYRNRLSAGIVLTGGGALLKDLDKLFRKHIGCDVRVAKPALYVTGDRAEAVSSPVYSTAVGLLMKGAEIGKRTQTIVIRKPKPILTPLPDEDGRGGYEGRYGQPGGGRSGDAGASRQTDELNFEDGERESLSSEREERPSRGERNARPPKEKGGIGRWFRGLGDRAKEIISPDDLDEDY